jgi:hypothetical protein
MRRIARVVVVMVLVGLGPADDGGGAHRTLKRVKDRKTIVLGHGDLSIEQLGRTVLFSCGKAKGSIDAAHV